MTYVSSSWGWLAAAVFVVMLLPLFWRKYRLAYAAISCLIGIVVLTCLWVADLRSHEEAAIHIVCLLLLHRRIGSPVAV